MKVGDIGEFALLEHIKTLVERLQVGLDSLKGIITGIGDDAAAWRMNEGIYLACTDGLVDGVHFNSGLTPWRAVGWKALAASLSDIAAMGGAPCYCLVSLALPRDIAVEEVEDIYQGLLSLANDTGVAVIGGNTGASSVVSVNTTVLGYIGPGSDNLPMTRGEARPGDQIAVTGYLGLAALGLQVLGHAKWSGLDSEAEELLGRRLYYPQPRISEGMLLRRIGVRAAIDVSDGLVSDLDRLCQASHVSARVGVEDLPLHPLITSMGWKAVEAALTGGEDYELVFTAPLELIERARTALSLPITVIGDITEACAERVSVQDTRGNMLLLDKGGWQHFVS